MKTRNKYFDKKDGVKLYYHQTSGGAEYLMDKYVLCPSGHKEGVFRDASIIIRIDGSKDVLTKKNI